MNKMLVVNPFGIGDVLFSTPLLKAIKKKYPDVSITYICNKRTEGLLKNNPCVSSIYVFEKDAYREMWKDSKIKFFKELSALIYRIRKDRYDAAIDISLGYMTGLLLFLFAAVPRRVGFNYKNRSKFLSDKVNIKGFDDKHVIEYYMSLGKAFGLDVSDKEMELTVSAVDSSWADEFLAKSGARKGDRICGLIPGCGASWGKDASYRRWSAWKFAKVADHVSDRHGYKILVFGDSKEIPLCSKVQSEMKAPAIQACGKTTLGQFAALLNRCDLVVTNDGGPLHMAIALKRKTVSIFGPVDEHIYGPYPPDRRYVTIASDCPCRPCYKNFKYVRCDTLNCLKDIKPDKVIRAVEALIGN